MPVISLIYWGYTFDRDCDDSVISLIWPPVGAIFLFHKLIHERLFSIKQGQCVSSQRMQQKARL
jgi:hypothetical protein